MNQVGMIICLIQIGHWVHKISYNHFIPYPYQLNCILSNNLLKLTDYIRLAYYIGPKVDPTCIDS